MSEQIRQRIEDDNRRIRREVLMRRVLHGLEQTIQIQGMSPETPTDDVRAVFTDKSARFLAPVLEAVDILERSDRLVRDLLARITLPPQEQLIKQWRTEARHLRAADPRHSEPTAKAYESCADQLSALLRQIQEPSPAQAWKPIETAPKDGTPVLLWIGHTAARIHVCRWFTPGWNLSASGNYMDVSWKPTHWQPLPSPPQEGVK